MRDHPIKVGDHVYDPGGQVYSGYHGRNVHKHRDGPFVVTKIIHIEGCCPHVRVIAERAPGAPSNGAETVVRINAPLKTLEIDAS